MTDSVSSATSSTSTGGLTTPSTGNKTLGKNEFLKLLTTQLANQDPLAPTDNQAFIAQLAQFSAVEQSEQMVSRLDGLLMAQTAANQTATATLVGKDVIYKATTVTLGASGSTSVNGVLSANASVANAIITDENGKKIRTITLHDAKAGDVGFSWDGKDDDGNPVKAGTYKVSMTAADAEGKNLEIHQLGRGHVSAISYDNGVPELMVDGQRIKMSDVLQIAEGTSSSSTASSLAANQTIADLITRLTGA